MPAETFDIGGGAPATLDTDVFASESADETPIDDTGVSILPEQPVKALLTDISGVDSAVADRLQAAGIQTINDLASSDPVELATATGVPVGQIMTEDWIGQARRLA
jgi:predicted flap endonuclease-1-like 5' DNA nuclease